MIFTATETRRADVFTRSVESFRCHLLGVEWSAATLFLNIDPAGSGSSVDVVAAAKAHFGTVIVNLPDAPNFAAAVKWCWVQPQSEYFMHCEFDWELFAPVEIGDMVSELMKDPSLSCVNLRPYSHDDDRLCLAPGLWRTDHARTIAGRLVTCANPEHQLRRRRDKNPYGGAHDGFRGKQFPRQRVLRDIGRDGLEKSGWRKDGGRFFNAWVTR